MLKMLPLNLLRFSIIGKPILRTFEILKNVRFFENSSRTRAKAKATARARRTRARGPRTGPGPGPGTVGRPDGAIYLAKCAAPF